MKIEYSKSLNDIGLERLERLNQNTNIKYHEQIKSSKILQSTPPRVTCLLCNKKLLGFKFNHRNVQFIRCKTCDHIQTFGKPPAEYPYFEKTTNFSNIYPNLNSKEYKDRVNRIYQPKLDWIKRVLKGKFIEDDLKSKEWVELGCGAGYFLSCLSSDGFKKITGYEMDPKLVKKTDDMTPNSVRVHHGDENLHDTIANSFADVYVAFFVLEHVEDPYKFYLQLSHLPTNTIFIFSVPLFGMSCLLEGVFDHLYSRNLDAVVHTQIYTEKSIDYALSIADFDMIGQWVFGQDAEDFSRFILDSLRENYPDDMFQEISTKLLNLQDPLQHVFDNDHLSDQRHIIAIKR
jgi:2-polyprenyl-3-methyl-5-hydroxy-6-metoxy-1,4-benzoquinol methylase